MQGKSEGQIMKIEENRKTYQTGDLIAIQNNNVQKVGCHKSPFDIRTWSLILDTFLGYLGNYINFFVKWKMPLTKI